MLDLDRHSCVERRGAFLKMWWTVRLSFEPEEEVGVLWTLVSGNRGVKMIALSCNTSDQEQSAAGVP